MRFHGVDPFKNQLTAKDAKSAEMRQEEQHMFLSLRTLALLASSAVKLIRKLISIQLM